MSDQPEITEIDIPPDEWEGILDELPSPHRWLALVSLILGIVNICSWMIPLTGFPIAIMGLFTGFLGYPSNWRRLAITGIILSSIGFLLVFANAIIGIFGILWTF